MCRIALVVTALLVPFSSARAASAVLKKLEAATAQVKAKEYERAIEVTQPLLDNLKLNTVEEIILAHKVLGVAQCELGDQAKATEHYEALLTFSPTETIDDLVATKPCKSLFDQARGVKEPTQAVVPPPVQPTPKPAPAATTVAKEASPREGAWKLYVPFGVGQFHNHEKTKGLAFLSTESLAFSLAIASYFLFKAEENPDGTFSNPDTASVYRGLYYGSLAVGGGAAIWGIIDAVLVDKKIRAQGHAYRLEVTPRSALVALQF